MDLLVFFSERDEETRQVMMRVGCSLLAGYELVGGFVIASTYAEGTHGW